MKEKSDKKEITNEQVNAQLVLDDSTKGTYNILTSTKN